MLKFCFDDAAPWLLSMVSTCCRQVYITSHELFVCICFVMWWWNCLVLNSSSHFISFSYVLHASKLTTILCNQHLTCVVLTGVCLLIRVKHVCYPLKQRWLEHGNTQILANLLNEYDGPHTTCSIAIEFVSNYDLLAPGICMDFPRWIIFKLIFVTDGWDLHSSRYCSQSLDLTDDKSTLVQVMALSCYPIPHNAKHILSSLCVNKSHLFLFYTSIHLNGSRLL